MGDDEEMKVQCFGGDYMGEVFDPISKRTSYRKQKRWWNAYMLFYTREDVEESALIKSLDELSLSECLIHTYQILFTALHTINIIFDSNIIMPTFP